MIFTDFATDPKIRAAGLWRVVDTELVQIAFWATPEMSREIADGFASATQRVNRSQTALGIVGAVMDGAPRISVAAELPPDRGSGLWLRRFEADRSVAMPLVRDDVTIAIVSVAIRGVENADLFDRLRHFLESWADGAGLAILDIPE